MSNTDDKRMITVDEAISLLPDGKEIHTFRNPGAGALIGADLKRERLIELMKTHADTLQVGGQSSRNMKHAIVLFDAVGPLFIANDKEKLDSFDPI